jgi:regulator of protease activity HflC (stomatin/prohibitin superfamily)
MSVLSVTVVILAVILLAVVAAGVRLVQQYERGVVLRFGRLLSEIREPGLKVIIPFADRMVKVPVQTVVMNVPGQGAITRDNVTLNVDAVVYFRVVDPARAVVNVENYVGAVSQVAQTSLRSVIGRADLDTMLSDREQVNAELRAVIDTPTEEWGVSVDRVEIRDIALPEGMRRSMSRQAEAERDRRARVISADGEFQASERLAAAAQVMAETPGALQLRLLQTVGDVAGDQNTTLIMPLPIELLRFFENAGGSTPTPRDSAQPKPRTVDGEVHVNGTGSSTGS